MKRNVLLLLVATLLVAGKWSPVTAQVAIGGDGTVTQGALLDLSQAVDAGGLLLPQIESADTLIEELKKPGMLVYNKTDGKVYTYNGVAWSVGSSGGGSSPAGACEDYIAGSWQTGKLCWYPTDASASIAYDAAMTTGCPLWWRVPTYSELRVFAAPTTLADYPLPDGFTMPTTGVYWSSTLTASSTGGDNGKTSSMSITVRSFGYTMGTNTSVYNTVSGMSYSSYTDCCLDTQSAGASGSGSFKLRCVRDI
ncbi:MAG: hypothetical protein LBN93_12205 [Candidatus Symbiothrix sp.]|jgi:hypothetical protein|nr:hypothetical protein [Candidatus Symbiothrix sp.]